MGALNPLTFKVASTPIEFEQIYRLNYRSFVDEIRQHPANRRRRLVDHYHGDNTYIVCLRGDTLLGMVAVCGQRPFSLDHKLDKLDTYLPPDRSMCEIRLLSVEKRHRNRFILPGLIMALRAQCERAGFDLALISGTVRQLKLYRHLGFVPFGPHVGTPDALYQPMYLTREAFDAALHAHDLASLAPNSCPPPAVNFLPGPVGMSARVQAAIDEPPLSHRSEEFLRRMRRTKDLLCRLVNARRVEILLGSGTLANDVVAGQLSLLARPGLVISNGEFGDRLIDHARRFGLVYDTLRLPWGEAIDAAQLELVLRGNHELAWLWAVHCETSTGMLNDVVLLQQTCRRRGLRLCLDCISSIGTTAIDLGTVYLASGSSGKGLRSYPGLSMVFYNRRIDPAPTRLPRSLDLGYYANAEGVPFTHSSNLMAPLLATLEQRLANPQTDVTLARLADWLRNQLDEIGLQVIAPGAYSSPAVITIAPRPRQSSISWGEALERAGFLVSYRSGYLQLRNWFQICLMSAGASREQLVPLLRQLRKLYDTETVAIGTGF